MKQYTLVDNLFIQPTPGGCYHAFSNPSDSPVKSLIRSLLRFESTPALTLDGLKQWAKIDDDEQVLSMLDRLQKIGWVQGLKEPEAYIKAPLEDALPPLLTKLGSQSKVLLADAQGFYLASIGFPHEVAEELSALSASLADLHERRSGLLLNNMGLNSSAWSLADSNGNSLLGFWPIYIGKTRFVLAVSGMPKLNHPDFVKLVWMLNMRYT